MRRNGYDSYHGRSRVRTFLKVLIVLLLVVLAVAVGALLWLEPYIDYSANGIKINLPFFQQKEPAPATGAPVVVTTPEPTPTPEPEEDFRGILLPNSALYDGTAAQQVEAAGATAALFDMKADDGSLGYISGLALAIQAEASAADPALNAAIQLLNGGEVYTVARVSCFRDNLVPRSDMSLAIHTNAGNWRDSGDTRWLSPANESARQYVVGVCRELAEKSELTQVLRAGADTQLQYLVFLCHRSAEEACQEVLKEYGFSRAALRGWTGTAAENDKRLEAGQAEAARTLEEAIAAVAGFAPRRAALELCLDRAVQEIAREEAKSRLLDSGTAFYLDGWVPVPEEEKLLRKLGEFTCCWETSDPAPEDYPVVPVKLKSNAITEPLTTITEMYSLPAYDGVDPNGLMAPFYIFFFGFMFADLGYGLLLAGACLFIQHKVRPKGGFGQLIRLMTMCGVSSAVIGLLTGGFFSDFLVQFTGMLGLPQPAVPFLSVPEGSGLPAPLLNVMEDPMTVLVFALAVGFVQIVVGMAVKFWMLCRDGQVWDAVWDVGTWWVIFAGIGLFALNLTGVSSVGSVAGIPVVLVLGCLMLLAQGRSAKGFGKVTAVIGAVYNGVTGYFGDILSYSRLMVMMLAGSVIGQVFNILGAMPGGGLPPAVGIPIFFVIFIVGHAFNIGLNVIGTYVHTSRLQYLEFFKQFYKEGGRPWRPLNIATKFVDIKEEQ